MYTIDYYTSNRKEPAWSNPKYDEISNIRSITIDVADIHAVVNSNEKKSSNFYGLMAHISRIPEATKVVIYNGNSIGASLIYDIIHTEWLVNKDDFKYSDELVRKLIEESSDLIEAEKASTYNKSYRVQAAMGAIFKLRHYILESDRHKNLDKDSKKEKLMYFALSKKRNI